MMDMEELTRACGNLHRSKRQQGKLIVDAMVLEYDMVTLSTTVATKPDVTSCTLDKGCP